MIGQQRPLKGPLQMFSRPYCVRSWNLLVVRAAVQMSVSHGVDTDSSGGSCPFDLVALKGRMWCAANWRDGSPATRSQSTPGKNDWWHVKKNKTGMTKQLTNVGWADRTNSATIWCENSLGTARPIFHIRLWRVTFAGHLQELLLIGCLSMQSILSLASWHSPPRDQTSM